MFCKRKMKAPTTIANGVDVKNWEGQIGKKNY
jgi:hypothetical protein